MKTLKKTSSKVLQGWRSFTEQENEGLPVPVRAHADGFCRPDLVKLVQETQPYQVRRLSSSLFPAF